MDRRIVFFLTFVITLTSICLVTLASLYFNRSVFETVLYAVATMWIMGVASQLLLQNLNMRGIAGFDAITCFPVGHNFIGFFRYFGSK